MEYDEILENEKTPITSDKEAIVKNIIAFDVFLKTIKTIVVNEKT